ncbi:hypothetical protein [Comamonas flocculans]|uniref:ABC transporter substrate-binding protein n=1 Tax=Comamonas flocculans TaxID=2597701 RepID=A0A5B8RS88_9BURK|nr:hypothetical protein [Comamonas flocculans]QEA12410.1 hypothetical protein FOZ74_04820 [Comamonas flocculans]
MTPRRILVACLCAFVLLLFALLIAFNHAKPRLLVLHTSSEDGNWEQLFDGGVRRALAGNRQPLAVRWHYMSFSDAEVQSSAEWQAASARARAVVNSWKPDVLLIVGEEAQQWLGYRYVSEDPRAQRLVYATGEDPQRFGYPGAANVTGVRELLPLAQIRDLLEVLEGRPLRIQALGMADPTGEVERDQVQAFDWQRHLLAPVQLVDTYAQWQQAVRDADGKADVLLVLSFAGMPRSAGEPGVVDSLEVARWTEANAGPLAISVRERFVQGGGALAIAPSAEGLGEQAGRLALRSLHDAALPAPQDSEDFAVGVGLQPLARRGYQLPGIYVQAARAAQLLIRDAPKPAGTPPGAH